MSKRRKLKLVGLILLACGIGSFFLWMFTGLKPVSVKDSPKTYIRYERAHDLSDVLSRLERQGVVRNAQVAKVYAFLTGMNASVAVGSYSVSPHSSTQEILRQLRRPIHQIVRLPETNWAQRTANVLNLHHVATAAEYMQYVHAPNAFAGKVSFPLPKGSLEGYLYPESYELPPLYGAKRVVLKQLKEFEKRIWNGKERPKDLSRTLIIASLVQLEAGKDEDRAMIAGVIENRIKKKMPLQIDATINYAIQKFRRLKFRDYREVKSPYNTYLTKGLPPGPICSPDAKDFEAALHPAKHDYLFYVALPNGQSIYSATYKEHLKNIQKRKAAIKALKS